MRVIACKRNQNPYVYFTEEQKIRANSVDLREFLEQQGDVCCQSISQKQANILHFPQSKNAEKRLLFAEINDTIYNTYNYINILLISYTI